MGDDDCSCSDLNHKIEFVDCPTHGKMYYDAAIDAPAEWINLTRVLDRASEPLFGSDRHALYVGWVLGIAMRNGLDVLAVTKENGDYTPMLHITLPSGDTITVVVPPPPDDWTFDG